MTRDNKKERLRLESLASKAREQKRVPVTLKPVDKVEGTMRIRRVDSPIAIRKEKVRTRVKKEIDGNKHVDSKKLRG